MAETAIPFNGAPVYDDGWRKMAQEWLTTGVINDGLNELAVSQRAAGANMSVDVASGRAWMKGHYYESDAVQNKVIAANSSGSARVDRIVVRADFVARTITVEVVTGTPGAGAPALTQTTARWEISLAQIAVANGAASIVTANITDERTYASAANVSVELDVLTKITTAVTVVNTVADTNLVNYTVPGGSIGTDKEIVLCCGGDWKQNSGAGQGPPRFKVKLGATTVLDTGASSGGEAANSALRWAWHLEARIAALGAANSLWARLSGRVSYVYGGPGGGEFDVGVGQLWTGTSARATEYEGGNADTTNMAAAQALVLSVILPTANASVDLVMKYASVKVVG